MTDLALKDQVAAVLHSVGEPTSLEYLMRLCDVQSTARDHVLAAIEALKEDYATGPVELVEVASGYRLQVRQSYAECIAKVENKKPPKASRALLETLALIAYRQPITRGEIEAVRGVAVSTQIIKTLLERGWVKVVGVREAPGKPALYGSTKVLLDHFNLQSLAELPPLDEIVDIDTIGSDLNEQLSLNVEGVLSEGDTDAPLEEDSSSDTGQTGNAVKDVPEDDPIAAALRELEALPDIADPAHFDAMMREDAAETDVSDEQQCEANNTQQGEQHRDEAIAVVPAAETV